MRKPIIMGPGTVGANVTGDPFKFSALVTTGVAVAGKLVLGKPYKLTSAKDAEALGLNEAYDTTNNVIVYHHIAEFYRMAGNGIPLYLLIAPQSILMPALIDDATNLYAKKLISYANGNAFNLAIGFNPEASYEEEWVDGLLSDVRTSFVKAQALNEWSADGPGEVQIILEGRSYKAPAVSVLDCRAIPGTPDGIFAAENVSICIAQDWDFADTLTGHAQKYAAIGTILGTLAACDLNQNIGEVAAFNLTNETKGKWRNAGLSNHITTSDQEADLDTLDEKGYIFADTVQGASGYRWNDDHTCAPKIVDADGNMNRFTIAIARTDNYVMRSLKTAYLPLVNGRVQVDKSTGKMSAGIRKSIEGIGNDVFEDMEPKGWLAGGVVNVDPNSDVQVANTVTLSAEWVPNGNIGKINGNVNIKVKI